MPHEPAARGWPAAVTAMLSLPTLSTARLVLRPATSDDVDALWALWTDADVRRFLFDDVAITREQAAATLADAQGAADGGLGLWVVHGGAAAAPVVGCAGLLPVSTAAEFEPRLAGMVEPLVALWPSHQGRGYAAEALGALVAYAFGPLGLERLAGVTDVPNVASDRMLRRAGFVPLGECEGPKYRMMTYVLARDG